MPYLPGEFQNEIADKVTTAMNFTFSDGRPSFDSLHYDRVKTSVLGILAELQFDSEAFAKFNSLTSLQKDSLSTLLAGDKVSIIPKSKYMTTGRGLIASGIARFYMENCKMEKASYIGIGPKKARDNRLEIASGDSTDPGMKPSIQQFVRNTIATFLMFIPAPQQADLLTSTSSPSYFSGSRPHQ